MTKNNIKKNLITLISSCAVTILSSAIGGYLSFKWCFVGSILLYLIFTYVIFYKFSYSAKNILLIALPPLLISGIVHIIDFKNTLVTLPNFFAQFIGIFSGILLYKFSSIIAKLSVIICCSLLAIWVYGWGYDYFTNKIFYGSFTSEAFEPAPELYLKDFSNKNYQTSSSVTLLDFWQTSCGYCYQQFPELEKLYQKNKTNNSVKIYAVNIPIDRDSISQAFYQLQQFNYHFPVLKSLEIDSVIMKDLKLTGFPYTIIIDKNNMIRYRGTLKGAKDAIDKILEE